MTKKDLFKKVPKSFDTEAKVLILTHTDADGAGAAIILKSIFKNADVKHCTNAVMSYEILNAVTDTFSEYEYIFACDISCSAEDAKYIDADIDRHKLILIDHHPTAIGLNQYDWACVEPSLLTDSYRAAYFEDVSIAHSSGTSLIYDYMEEIGLIDNIKNLDLLKKIVHLIASYDTWDWKNVLGGQKVFNDFTSLCNLYGIDIFEQTMIERLEDNKNKGYDMIFTETDELLLNIEATKIQKHLEAVEKCFVTGSMVIKSECYRVMYCYSNKYLQETFEKMKEEDDDLDLYIINYGTGISVRAIRDDIDVGKIMKLYNGGGHPGAGGFRIPFYMQTEYMERVFNAKVIPAA